MIRLAEISDLEPVLQITHDTISEIYSHYYAKGVVDFFLEHHSREHVLSDVENGLVWLLEEEGCMVGTVTVKENVINRLFVLPEYQSRGYGSQLMDFAENKIAQHFTHIHIDSSLAAKELYLKRGYKEKKTCRILADNGDILIYDEMEKRLNRDLSSKECIALKTRGGSVSVEYRRLTEKELEVFIDMRIKQLREEGAKEDIDLKPALRKYYNQHMADGTFVSWLAFDEDKIVGTSGMSFVEKSPYFGCPSGKVGLLSSMFTSKEYRRQGIAKELLSKVMNEAREYGCGTVQITASDMGVLLYTDFGFVKNENFMQYKL